jgi:hypothetical protein
LWHYDLSREHLSNDKVLVIDVNILLSKLLIRTTLR